MRAKEFDIFSDSTSLLVNITICVLFKLVSSGYFETT